MKHRLSISLFVSAVLFAIAGLAFGLAQPALAQSGGPPTNPLYLPVVVRRSAGPPPITPTPPPTATPTPPPTPTPVPARPWSVYGLQAPVKAESLASLANAGATWVRPSLTVRWSEVEPVEGQRNWSALKDLEAELQAAYEKGFWTIVTVHSAPTWAQAVPGKSCGPVQPAKLKAFAAFLSDLATRYSPPPYGVRHWLLWDEIDTPYSAAPLDAPGCWGDPSQSGYGGADYARLLQAAYPALKTVDPQARLILGGLRLECKDCLSARFLDGVLLGGGGTYFDLLGFYAYDELAPFDFDWGSTFQSSNAAWGVDWFHGGPSLKAKLDFIQQTFAAHGVGGKGYLGLGSGLECDGCDYTGPAYRQAKADYLAGLYAAAHRLEALVWDDLAGLAGEDMIPQVPADLPYFAYQFSRLDGPGQSGAYLGALQPGDVGGVTDLRGYRYARPDGELWVVWLVSAELEFRSVTFAQTPAAAYDVYGNPVNILPDVAIGVSPVYLTFQK